jgi:hypothetical protein
MPHSIDAADARERVGAGVVGAAGQLLVDWLQRGRMNMYDHLAVARDWLFERLVSRRCTQRM